MFVSVKSGYHWVSLVTAIGEWLKMADRSTSFCMLEDKQVIFGIGKGVHSIQYNTFITHTRSSRTSNLYAQNCCNCLRKVLSYRWEPLKASCCFMRKSWWTSCVESHFVAVKSVAQCWIDGKCWQTVRFGFGLSTFHSGSLASSLSHQYVVCSSLSLRSAFHIMYIVLLFCCWSVTLSPLYH